MHVLIRLFETGLIVWFFFLAVLIAGRTLRGDIKTTGFLRNEQATPVAPERAIHLSVFPVVILSYVFIALHTNVHVEHPSLPDVPQDLLLLLTSGNGIYLAGKIARNT